MTQLSHYLLAYPIPAGALRAGLLLIMVWLLWVYTTWVTNWLDPGRIALRLLLLGLAVGAAYAVMQIGRSGFTVAALPRGQLQCNFQRILCRCLVSGALVLAGGFAGGNARTPGLLDATRRAGRPRAACSGCAAGQRARAERLHGRRDHRGRGP